MKLVRSWLDAVGLQARVGTFEAAGITTPAALAELEVDHFEALGVRSDEERRKLFFLVQRIRKAIADRDATVLESETPPTSPEDDENSRGSDPAEKAPQESRNRQQEFSHATARADAAAPSGRNTSKPAVQHEHDDDDDALDSLLRNDTHEEDDEIDEAQEVGSEEGSQGMEPGTALRTTNLPQRQTRSSAPSSAATQKNGSIPVAARQSLPSDASVASKSKTGIPRKSDGAAASASRQRSSSSDSRTRRLSGVPEPASRMRPPESRLPQPSSMRTGKQLSTIPSNKTAPMSPLVDLPKTSQLVHKDSGDEGGAGERRSTRGRRRSSSFERQLSESASDSETGSVASESGIPRHSSLPRARRRSLSDQRPPRSGAQPSNGNDNIMASCSSRPANSRESLDSENIGVPKSSTGARVSLGHRSHSDINPRSAATPSVTIQGRKEDNSFKSQIQQLREENDDEYESFGTTDDQDDPEMRIRVVIRKRPMSEREIIAAGDIDVIHPLDYGSYGKILVYQPKTRVDLTKEIDTVTFAFDNVFDERSTNQQVYERCIRKLIPSLFEDESAVVSIFAYGQTGSGKTFTMLGSEFTGLNDGSSTESLHNLGIYYMASLDIFHLLRDPEHQDYSVSLSLFEIYGGKLFDLLNDREAIKCLEDNRGKVNFPGLSEHDVADPGYLMELISIGAANRSTGTTSRNADSSRSHAVMQIHIKKPAARGKMVEHSRLTVVDLAGSERGADTATASLSTRLEGAEINTSLLALKEVIRAMATGDPMTHIPFRGSKLTQVLKESFVGPNCRSVMIGCISPNIGNCEQTLNTLRYADRVKQRNSATGEYTGRVDEESSSQHPRRSSTSLCRSESQASTSTAKETYSIGESDGPLETGSQGSVSAMLDDLLSSPPPKQPMSRASSYVADAGATARSAADPLIQCHKSAMTRMMEMLKDEMDIVYQVDGDHNDFDEYIGRTNELHEEQLSYISAMREQLLLYQSTRNAISLEFSSEDSFEDLRD